MLLTSCDVDDTNAMGQIGERGYLSRECSDVILWAVADPDLQGIPDQRPLGETRRSAKMTRF